MGGIDDSQAAAPGERPQEPAPGERRVFRSTLAGTWYPADEGGVRRELQACLARAPERSVGSLCGLILPHAGYAWSGATAAHAIRLLEGTRWDRVVILGPAHRARMENVASVPDESHYATPLGALELDRPFIESLRRDSHFTSVPPVEHAEHSVQIQLPLLQHALGPFRLVPVVVGQLDEGAVGGMAAVLRRHVDSRTLVVASSDFTHYGRRFGYVPFHDDLADNIRRLDMGALECIRAKDTRRFLDYVARTQATICGRHAIAVLLAMLPEEAAAELLHYDTSGRLSGDYSHSVSYLAVAFSGQWPEAAAPQEQAQSAPGQDVGPELLRLARRSLHHAAQYGQAPTAGELDILPSMLLQKVAAAFVTLRKRGDLRGCVGEIYATRPLYEAVLTQAANAALNDRRFPSVAAEELDDLSIEISVLTPPRPVASIAEIAVGQHGIVLRKGNRCAVFLPKVAVEHGWTVEQTLDHLARKAGLIEDDWRTGAVIEVFEAFVVTEEAADAAPTPSPWRLP